ncbi:MAG: DUF4349 domain-containing protein [Polyangiaceae bacterium]
MRLRALACIVLTLSSSGLAACGAAPYASPGGVSNGNAPRRGMAPMLGVESYASEESDDLGGSPMQESPPAAPPRPAPQGAKASSSTTETTPQNPAAPRSTEARSPILIYTADFVLAVYETEKTVDAVQDIAERAGGYLSRRSDTSITVRIPADRFQAAITEMQALGEVVRRNVSSEDVTAEYRDLEVQLANAVAMRDRFAALLSRATTVTESLEIERELGRVTATIERIRGRLKVLADLAAYSTVTVEVQRKQSAILQQGPFNLPLPWLNDLGLPRLMNL